MQRRRNKLWILGYSLPGRGSARNRAGLATIIVVVLSGLGTGWLVGQALNKLRAPVTQSPADAPIVEGSTDQGELGQADHEAQLDDSISDARREEIRESVRQEMEGKRRMSSGPSHSPFVEKLFRGFGRIIRLKQHQRDDHHEHNHGKHGRH